MRPFGNEGPNNINLQDYEQYGVYITFKKTLNDYLKI